MNKKAFILQIIALVISVAMIVYFIVSLSIVIKDVESTIEYYDSHAFDLPEGYIFEVYGLKIITTIIYLILSISMCSILTYFLIIRILKIIKPTIIQNMEAKRQERISKQISARELKRHEKIAQLEKQLEELKKDD